MCILLAADALCDGHCHALRVYAFDMEVLKNELAKAGDRSFDRGVAGRS
jgi:hypothetical protein